MCVRACVCVPACLSVCVCVCICIHTYGLYMRRTVLCNNEFSILQGVNRFQVEYITDINLQNI